MGEIIEKKRNASNATDATMPMVVNTAIVEQPISSHSMTRSTRLRARTSGVIFERTTSTVPTTMTSTSTVSAMRLMPRRWIYSAEAARTDSGAVRRDVARDDVAHVVDHQRQLVLRQIAHAGRQLIHDQSQDDGVLEHEPHPDHGERRQRAPHRRHQSVMAGKGMKVAYAARAAHERERACLADPEGAHRKEGQSNEKSRRCHRCSWSGLWPS